MVVTNQHVVMAAINLLGRGAVTNQHVREAVTNQHVAIVTPLAELKFVYYVIKHHNE